MATRVYCDRCGKLEEEGAPVRPVKVTQADTWRTGGEHNVAGGDLCEWCTEHLKDFFKPLPKPAEAPPRVFNADFVGEKQCNSKCAIPGCRKKAEYGWKQTGSTLFLCPEHASIPRPS